MARSKDSNRQGQTDKKMTDLNQALREAMEALGRTRKDIAYRHRLRQNLPRVKFDKGHLEQVLQGLFDGAAEAMPGGGTLTVETSVASREEARKFIPQPESDLYVRLRIRDGATLKPSRKSPASRPVFVFPVLTDGGGHISVETEKGEGTTVIVHLPVSATEVSRFIGAHGGKKIESGGSETILIVDDDGTIVETTCEILKALGYSVLTACSGEQALEVYRSAKDRIDLVLLDFMMPGMKGDETFRQLKSIDPEARVVLMSGYNIEKELEAILSLGFDGFLIKPFKVYELTKALRSVLEKSA
jgi:two-component system cell cycle sensor histidine kinase/response regulator CckA